MKRVSYFLCLILLIPGFVLNSCKTSENYFNTRKFIREYKKEPGFISLNLPKGIIRFFLDEGQPGSKELLKDLRRIRVLVSNSNSDAVLQYDKVYKELNSQLAESQFNDLMIINESGTEIKFKIHVKREKVREILVMINSDEDFILLSLKGKIDLKEAAEITRNFRIDGFKKLE